MYLKKTLTSALLGLGITQILLAEDRLEQLPFGTIKPTGWIATQMRADIDTGFVGHLDKLVPDLIYEDDIYGKNRLSRKIKRKDVGTHHQWPTP